MNTLTLRRLGGIAGAAALVTCLLPAPRTAAFPEPDQLDRARAVAALGIRPEVHYAIVIDVSGSMSQKGRFGEAKKGVRAFLNGLDDDARVALVPFTTEVDDKPEPSLLTPRAALAALEDLEATKDGGTSVAAGLRGALAVLKAGDAAPANVVVLFTDAQDETADPRAWDDLPGLVPALRARTPLREPGFFRAYTLVWKSRSRPDLTLGSAGCEAHDAADIARCAFGDASEQIPKHDVGGFLAALPARVADRQIHERLEPDVTLARGAAAVRARIVRLRADGRKGTLTVSLDSVTSKLPLRVAATAVSSPEVPGMSLRGEPYADLAPKARNRTLEIPVALPEGTRTGRDVTVQVEFRLDSPYRERLAAAGPDEALPDVPIRIARTVPIVGPPLWRRLLTSPWLALPLLALAAAVAAAVTGLPTTVRVRADDGRTVLLRQWLPTRTRTGVPQIASLAGATVEITRGWRRPGELRPVTVTVWPRGHAPDARDGTVAFEAELSPGHRPRALPMVPGAEFYLR